MPSREILINILKQTGLIKAEESKTRDEAIAQENRVTMAFFKGEITLEEYYQRLEETNPLTNTDFRGLASESDKHRYFKSI